MNYTKVIELYGEEKFNLAPRFHECDTILEDYPNLFLMMNMWDTDREKQIDLGLDYPYEPLEKCECIAPAVWQKSGIAVGDTLKLNMHDNGRWEIIVRYYNEEA